MIENSPFKKRTEFIEAGRPKYELDGLRPQLQESAA